MSETVAEKPPICFYYGNGRLIELAEYPRVVLQPDFYTPAELDQQYAKVPANLKPRFEAYTAGINAWISHVQTSPADMPAEFFRPVAEIIYFLQSKQAPRPEKVQ